MTYCRTARSSSSALTRFLSLGESRASISSISCASTSSGACQTCTASGARSIEGDNLDLRLALRDGQPRDTWLEVEPPRPGGSGVDHKPALGVSDELAVGVPIDENVLRVGRQELMRSGASYLMSMTDVDGQSTDWQNELIL